MKLNLNKGLKNILNLLAKHYRLLITLLIIVLFATLGYYLYQKYYLIIYRETPIDTSILQAKQVKLNTNLYEKVKENMQNKKQVDFSQLDEVNNPFTPY